MQYNFDEIIDRTNSNSLKWDMVDDRFGGKDLLPLWVADMDFRIAQPIVDALYKTSRHGIFGYTALLPSYFEAVINWFEQKHGWSIKKEWIVFCPGIVPALNMLVQSLTQPGDKVIIQQPVYYPFMQSVTNNERTLVNNSLIFKEGKYFIDFKDLEEKAKDPLTKMLIFCSPHNPGGRVWTKDELIRLGEICVKNDLIIVSDEIHCDLTLNGHIHTPFASLSDEFLKRSVTCTAPSKTFNIAGLQISNVVIPDPLLRRKFAFQLSKNGIYEPNSFGAAGAEAAYRYGDEWLQQLKKYLEENLKFLIEFVKNRMPDVKVMVPEATYLVWLDFTKVAKNKDLKELLIKKAKVALSDGRVFGEEGEGFVRMNIACPKSTLETALLRIEKAIEE